MRAPAATRVRHCTRRKANEKRLVRSGSPTIGRSSASRSPTAASVATSAQISKRASGRIRVRVVEGVQGLLVLDGDLEAVAGAVVGGMVGGPLGAMAGGVIEYVSLITGYRALLIVVAGLYSLAFLAGRRDLTTASADERGPAEVRVPAETTWSS